MSRKTIKQKINTKDDKAIIEEAMNNIVTGGTEEIQQVKKIAEAKSRKYVVQFYEYFFAGISDGSISHGNNSEYSAGSVQVWKTFGRYLHEYCAGNVTFDDIDKPFADRFTQFLQKKGFMSNTINKNVTCFRKLCNLSTSNHNMARNLTFPCQKSKKKYIFKPNLRKSNNLWCCKW